jgi:hydroxyethylthiazole kinase-like uncharacterized protein yjeF
MQALLTPKDMYDLDAYLIDKIGITEGNLMEGAALSCSNLISEYSKHGSKILIVCGTGNNGGDGLAIAKYLNNNYNVDFIIFGEKSQFNSLSLKNYDILKNLNVNEIELESIDYSKYDLIIDSILGIGSDGSLKDNLVQIISNINKTSAIKISIDIPTGLNPYNGIVLTTCIKANYTITMYGYKTGLLLNDGKDNCGLISIADLGIPKDIIASYASYSLLDNFEIIKKRNNSSKFDYGKVLIIAGNDEMPGAACLCANSSISAGAGLVYLVSSIRDTNLYSEIISISVDKYKACVDNEKVDNLSFINNVDAVIVGPGLGKNEVSKGLLENTLLKYDGCNTIIDADGLNYIDYNRTYNKRVILTPHIVEFSRLINISLDEILIDIPKFVKEAAKKMNLNIVLKGPTTVISNGEDVIFVNNGIPEMATAGSGDVLSGIIGSYINYDLMDKPIKNIANAVFIHNYAARKAAENKSLLIASDIYKALQCIK